MTSMQRVQRSEVDEVSNECGRICIKSREEAISRRRGNARDLHLERNGDRGAGRGTDTVKVSL